MRKIIAVLGYGTKSPQSTFTYPADTINAGYASSIIKAGALPMLIPSTLDEETIRSTVERIDAILIPGGGDICPSLYGEEEREYTLSPNKDNDLFQMKAIEEALRLGKPILGICRGLQVLNVFFGGTLYQDIGKERQKSLRHSHLDIPEGYAHSISITEGSFLYEAVKEKKMEVNSLHHQGIKTLGAGLAATAESPDGLVEAIENRGNRIMAVQWHPEALVMKGDGKALGIFKFFISLLE